MIRVWTRYSPDGKDVTEYYVGWGGAIMSACYKAIGCWSRRFPGYLILSYSARLLWARFQIRWVRKTLRRRQQHFAHGWKRGVNFYEQEP